MAMASNLLGMASNLLAMASRWNLDQLELGISCSLAASARFSWLQALKGCAGEPRDSMQEPKGEVEDAHRCSVPNTYTDRFHLQASPKRCKTSLITVAVMRYWFPMLQ